MKDLLLTIAEFLEEEADNRAAAGSEMSDYEREPRELAERLRVALSRRPSREEYERTIIDVLDKWHDGCRERKAREITDALLALFGGQEKQELSLSQDHAPSTTDGRPQEAPSPGAERPKWACKRCGRNEIDARENGCTRGPCPMEFVG
jgi:hypothetical protein